MPDFQYRAVKSTGGVESGHITARDVAAAKKQLQLDGKTPLSVAISTVSTASSKAERGVDSSNIPEEQLEKLLARLGDTAGKKRRKKRRFAGARRGDPRALRRTPLARARPYERAAGS